MMRLSTRYALPLAMVFAVALAPPAFHAFARSSPDSGRRTSDVRVLLDGSPGMSTGRSAGWVKRRLASDDWMERSYLVDARPLVLFVGRSRDPKSLYHHPELALAYGRDLTPKGIVDLEGIPAHALVTRDGEPAVVLYALRARDTFVTNPIRFQMQSVATDLLRGPAEMTLFFVVEERPLDTGDLARTGAARLLHAAVDAFTAQ